MVKNTMEFVSLEKALGADWTTGPKSRFKVIFLTYLFLKHQQHFLKPYQLTSKYAMESMSIIYTLKSHIKRAGLFNLLTELLLGLWPLKVEIQICCHQCYGQCTLHTFILVDWVIER